MSRLTLSAAGLALAGLIGLASPVVAQDKTYEWKYSHWVPATHPLHGILQGWAKSIDDGVARARSRSPIFPAQQLGKAPDHYDMVEKGIADVAYVSTGYQAGRMLVTSVAQMPFMMTNAEGGSKAFDEWYRPYAAKDMPGVKLCYMYTHDVASLHSKKEIRTPDQIKGMKIRPAHATMAQWMNALGATTVQVSAPESREALERGVADAITFPCGSLYAFKIDGITKFHIDEPMYVATFATIINQGKYDALSADQKKVIDAHCTTEWAGKTAGRLGQVGRRRPPEDARRRLRPHHDKLKPDELAAWRKSAEPVMAKWMDDMKAAGYDGPKVLAEFKAALKKYNALAE